MSKRWPGLRHVFRLPKGAKQVRADVDAELAFHIEGRIDELVAGGMSRDDAEREARRRFGDFARIEGEVERLDRERQRRHSLRERIDALIRGHPLRLRVGRATTALRAGRRRDDDARHRHDGGDLSCDRSHRAASPALSGRRPHRLPRHAAELRARRRRGQLATLSVLA